MIDPPWASMGIKCSTKSPNNEQLAGPIERHSSDTSMRKTGALQLNPSLRLKILWES
jgi:hypothetical protein